MPKHTFSLPVQEFCQNVPYCLPSLKLFVAVGVVQTAEHIDCVKVSQGVSSEMPSKANCCRPSLVVPLSTFFSSSSVSCVVASYLLFAFDGRGTVSISCLPLVLVNDTSGALLNSGKF